MFGAKQKRSEEGQKEITITNNGFEVIDEGGRHCRRRRCRCFGYFFLTFCRLLNEVN